MYIKTFIQFTLYKNARFAYEISIIYRMKIPGWPITTYIIQKGGDINFPIEWEDYNHKLGSGRNYGRAVDFANYLQKEDTKHEERISLKNYTALFELLAEKVKQ
jgi:hypothetical protein